MKTINLKIPRMSHEKSQQIVTTALKKTGIYTILAMPGELQVSYNDSWKKANIIEVIEETGYIVVNY